MKTMTKRIVALSLLLVMMMLMTSCTALDRITQALSGIFPNINLSGKTDEDATTPPELIDGEVYAYYSNGERVRFRDEFITIDGKTYFVFENKAITGLYVIDDSIYCFDGNGEMIVGEHDGYTFGADGRLIGNEMFVDARAVRDYNVPTAIMEEDFIESILNPMLAYYEDLIKTILIPDAAGMNITLTEEDYVFASKDVWGYQNSKGKWFYEDKYDEYGNLRFDALTAYLNYLESITNTVYPIITNATNPNRSELRAANTALMCISTSFTLIEPANTAAFGEGGYAEKLVELVPYYSANPGTTQAIYVCSKSIVDGFEAALANIETNFAKYAGYTEKMRAVHEDKCMMQSSLNVLDEVSTYCLVNNKILRCDLDPYNEDPAITVDGITYVFDLFGRLEYSYSEQPDQ